MTIPRQRAATADEKLALAAQLSFLYLEKRDTSDLSPSDFANEYFEIKKQIERIVAEHQTL